MQRVELDGLYEDHGYVFADQVGRPLDPFVLTDTWRKRVTRKAGVRCRLHDLRHVHASGLLLANVHPKVVAERLGHATIMITLDLYTHTVPSLQQQAALDFAEVMQSSAAGKRV